MTKLHELFDTGGQSPWLDNLRRGWITGGELQAMIDDGVRGLTSNPTIFAKAISGEDSYDDQFRSVVGDGADVTTAYWELVLSDIRSATDLLAGVHESSGGVDGFVSVEVDPGLARDSDGTLTAARDLHTRLSTPNVMVKIPGTAEGLPAIRTMISELRSINVTLIFGLDRYAEVMEAHIGGLEDALTANPSADLSGIGGVASFFISRVDTEVDRRLLEIGSDDALALKGKVAVAQAVVAYDMFRSTFSGDRWAPLAAAGARVQRPLWASTSTKDPSYPDTLYVDTLIGPDTVNTMPDATIEAFLDRGTVARTIDADVEAAKAVLDGAAAVGVDMDDVAKVLEDQGVASFEKSFDELIGTLEAKKLDLGG